MPADAEMMKRLRAFVAHPPQWSEDVSPQDVSAIRWAVERIGALEGALEPDHLARRLHQAWGRYELVFGVPPHGTLKQIRAMLEFGVAPSVLSPAPAKEEEVPR